MDVATIDRTARQRARQQGGVLRRRDALALGITPAQVATAVRSARWSVVTHGAYAPRPVLPPAGSADRAALEVAAAVLRVEGDPVAVECTGALIHRLSLLGPPPAAAQLAWPRVSPGPVRTDVRTCWLPPEHVTELRGVRVTTPARTVVDVARRRGLLAGVVTADPALAGGLRQDELGSVMAACRRWPGSRTAARVIELARPLAESPLESLGRVQLVLQGLPEPELQVEVYDGDRFVARVDHCWRELRVVAEADGLGKYTEPGVLRAEKLREDRLRELGFEVVRYTWAEVLHRPERVAARVRAAFARARRRRR